MQSSRFEPDRPEGDHDIRMPDAGQPRLDDAVADQPEPPFRLVLAHVEPGAEPVLADAAADRSRELAGLQVRDAELSVEVRRPRCRVGFDAQLESVRTGAPPREGGRPRGPMGCVIGPPARQVEFLTREALVDGGLPAAQVEG